MQQPFLEHTECEEDFDPPDEAHIFYMLRLIFLMIFCKSLRAVIRMLVGFLKFYRSLICLSLDALSLFKVLLAVHNCFTSSHFTLSNDCMINIEGKISRPLDVK